MQHRTVSAAFRTSRLIFYRRFLQKQVSGCPWIGLYGSHVQCLLTVAGAPVTPCGGFFPLEKGCHLPVMHLVFTRSLFVWALPKPPPCFPARAALPLLFIMTWCHNSAQSFCFRTSRLIFYRRFLQKRVSGCPWMLTFVYTHAMLANRRFGSGYPLRGLFTRRKRAVILSGSLSILGRVSFQNPNCVRFLG